MRIQIKELRKIIKTALSESRVKKVADYHILIYEAGMMSSFFHLAGPFDEDPSQIPAAWLRESIVETWSHQLGDPSGDDLRPLFRQLGIDVKRLSPIDPHNKNISADDAEFYSEAWIKILEHIAFEHNVLGGVSYDEIPEMEFDDDDEPVMDDVEMLDTILIPIKEFIDNFTVEGEKENADLLAAQWKSLLGHKKDPDDDDDMN